MPVLENTRYELFAQGIAQGRTLLDAYIRAGYKANRGNAAALNSQECIQERVRELQQAGAKRAEVTQESLIREIDEAIAAAAKRSPSAVVAGLALKARITGHWAADRVNDRTPVSDMPQDAVEAELDRLRAARIADNDRPAVERRPDRVQ